MRVKPIAVYLNQENTMVARIMTSHSGHAPTLAAKRKAAKRKYGTTASKKVGRAMHEMKEGTLKSGRSGKKVKSRKQAIAIGLSEARRGGAKVPKKKK
jgi:hypothetical protein